MSANFATEGSNYDVVVVGAGVAGLAGATALGRAGFRVLVTSLPNRRNSAAGEVHNLPFAEGVSPQELYARMEATLAAYEVDLRWEMVEHVKLDTAIKQVVVKMTTGVVTARRLILATGFTDDVPAWVPEGAWGRQVFTCPFCHSFEYRGSAFVVAGKGVIAVEVGLLCAPHAATVTVLVSEPDAVDGPAADRVRALGGTVLADTVEAASLESGSVHLATRTGREIEARAVVLSQLPKSPYSVLTEPRLTMTQEGIPESTPEGRTSHPLVWVAGNTAAPTYLLVESMGSGVRAGVDIAKDLTFEGLH